MLSEENIHQLKELIRPGAKVAISTHKGPDGDAIGSSVALSKYLENKGCYCSILVPDDFPDFLKWVPHADKIMIYDRSPDDVLTAINEANLIFSLDYNDLKRVDEIGEQIAASTVPKILIDHHEEPKGFEDITFHDATCCSTAQLVYEFIEEMGDLVQLDEDVATGIYLGIMTDTGSFRFPSVTQRTHQIIGHLLSLGLKHHIIHEAVYDDNSLSRLQLNGFAVSERLELLQNDQVAIIWLTASDLSRFQARKGDTEGLVNKALSIKGVKMAAFFREKDGLVKISFRSKGDIYVNEMARDHFGGGGHKYAAGGASEAEMIDTIDRFKKIVGEYV